MSALKKAIACVGGVAAAAKACEVSQRAVYKWIAADALPRTEYTGETNYVERLERVARETGKPFDASELKNAAIPKRVAA